MILERQIAKKITELTSNSIAFIETEFQSLTPAGKYEACILTCSLIFQLLQEKDVMRRHNLSVDTLNSYLEDEFLILFNKFKNEYLAINRNIDKFDDKFLDTFLVTGNDGLISGNSEFVKTTIRFGIMSFLKELEDYRKGFERYNSGMGKIIQPELIFNCLYVSPFLYLEPNIGETCFLIANKIKGRNPSIYSFITIPAQLAEQLSNLINKDTSFVRLLIYGYNRSGIQQKSNKNCYVATLVYKDIDHPKVIYLRKFRDNNLSHSKFGKLFIKYYYKHSPKVVSFLKPYTYVNRFIKKSLDLLIFILKKIE